MTKEISISEFVSQAIIWYFNLPSPMPDNPDIKLTDEQIVLNLTPDAQVALARIVANANRNLDAFLRQKGVAKFQAYKFGFPSKINQSDVIKKAIYYYIGRTES